MRVIKSSKRKKSLLAMVAIFVCALVLLGGTFAWTDFTQNATNKFRGTQDPDVTLHDEFDGKSPNAEKHIFVENSGNQEIYVRLRLDEYMEISGDSFVSTANVRDKTTWTPHLWNQDITKITDCVGGVAGKFHDYFKWQVKGEGRDYKPGTPGLVYTKLDSSGNVDPTGPNSTSAEMKPVTMKAYVELLDETASGLPLSTAAQETQVNITAGCWILDVDGWAYWSKVLKKDEATNLLLSKVEQKKNPTDDWYYGIDVKLQAVTLNDTEKWAETYTKTSNADRLITEWKAV